MRALVFTVMILGSILTSGCAADTHLRHDDTSRSSGDTRGNPY